ncbi:fluoride efflux transporter CrcB [Photobacterium damselae subsp. piscicida]|uniref:Fluoride-specific ion channel FluC n=1 Tax=Photobacterium damsela subsp. piscicida TaxID=38294 RepID=A0A1Q9H221_PHODP|nr:fluoride efflux transporter CrcB [Photobacterium damselae]MBE8128001.1 fluoride efflux transporter CrcB [Photobacterium damselae subsp. piscicida]MDP2516428.1 fluoride efflux transporter CrcB [Photobacterium damselae subsp. piscicida]MDP2533462.1 fluoride efflux transporter CrcB [Photobacterium damselae subsp. piscicida]MDP2544061.1 fluoride efflux transporter CrcB [Photobacterium damselae subsp. piscicida]MDP2557216.1 fluoride efflux transporter CrcB [Photobacterium damselae subsp. piscici
MSQFVLLGFIALGGAFGACSRYLVSELCMVLFGRGFPYGTLTVNIVGSLIMGLLMSALNQGMIEAAPWRPIIGLGFLGALTTFSTFSMDNVVMIQQGEFVKAGLNIILNVVLSITACYVGYQLMMKS